MIRRQNSRLERCALSVRALGRTWLRQRHWVLSFVIGLGLVACTSVPSATPKLEVPPSNLNLESFLLRLANASDDNRAREFLETACQGNFLAACDALGKDIEPYLRRVPILQGATTSAESEFVVLQSKKQPLYLLVWAESLRAPVATRQSFQVGVPQSDYELIHFAVEGLIPGKEYKAQWVTREGTLVDARTFRTLPVGGRRVRLAVASCLYDGDPEQSAQWLALLKEEPEMLFLIGDNVYADVQSNGTPQPVTDSLQLWKRYLETRRALDLFFTPRLVPVLAVWDDHDFGTNDGNQEFSHKEASREVFRSFFGNATYPGVIERGPGVSFRFDAFGQVFFFLDDRFYRSPPEKKAGPSAMHFGRDVEGWLFAALDGRTPVWLISGDQFFGNYHPFESFEGHHPTNFKKFLERLKSRANPVVFLSGDRHLTEVQKIEKNLLGFETYEMTTSALHAKTFPDAFEKHPNPRQMAGKAGEVNFFMLDVSTEGKWQIQLQALGKKGRSLYRLNLRPAEEG